MKQTITFSSMEVSRILFDHLQDKKILTGKRYDTTIRVRGDMTDRSFIIICEYDEVKENANG